LVEFLLLLALLESINLPTAAKSQFIFFLFFNSLFYSLFTENFCCCWLKKRGYVCVSMFSI